MSYQKEKMNNLLDINKLNEYIMYDTLEVYRVSKMIKRDKIIQDSLLFNNIFQGEAKDSYINPMPDVQIFRKGIKMSNDFILTHHKVNNDYDLLTVLKEDSNRKSIYWLSYILDDNYEIVGNDTIFLQKGDMTNFGILAEKHTSDSTIYEVYSSFLDVDKIKQTTIKKDLITHKTDSIIDYVQLAVYPFNDGIKGIQFGTIHFVNGKLVEEIWDDEVEWIKQEITKNKRH
jgi:hypothetical protein